MAGRKKSTSKASNIGQKPDDVPEGLWKMFMSINDNIKANGDSIKSLEDTVLALTETNTKLTVDVDSLESRVSLLESKLCRSERSNTRLQHEILDLQTRSMKNNLIFSFDKMSRDYGQEADGEDCVSLVKHFLVSVLGIQSADKFFIPVAHRIGAKNPAYPRSVVAKFPVATELTHVMKQTGRLKDTRHFINRQIPAALRERNQFAMDEFNDKRKDPGNRARLIGGKLFLKGKPQQKYLPPRIAAVDPEYECTTDISSSDPISDSGSKFQGYAADADNEQDVAAILDQSLLLPGVASATHRIYAYRYEAGSVIVENFDSDGDDGIGLQLLKSMREDNATNQLWMVTRTCQTDFSHIGKRRFQHSIKVCQSAAKGLSE